MTTPTYRTKIIGVRRRTLAIGLTLAVLLGAVVAGRLAAPAPLPTRPDPAAWQMMLHRWRSRADVPAAVLGVATPDGRHWVGADGTTERNGGVPARVDSPFRIASITKVFVAVVVLQLVEEGRLRLDEPVSRYVPEAAIWPATIHQLLNHTSGIPDYGMSDDLVKKLRDHRDRRWTAREVIALVANKKPAFPAGTDYAYSNTDYILLGQVIQAVTGHTWAHEVRGRILGPINLRNTFIAGVERLPRPIIAGYFDLDDDGAFENVETGRPWTALETSEGAAGAIVSTAPDLLTFAGALFHGHLLNAASMRAMTSEACFHPRLTNYGLGLEIARPDYHTTVWGHGGYLPGFRSILWYIPSKDAAVVVLTNDVRAEPRDLAELTTRTLPERGQG